MIDHFKMLIPAGCSWHGCARCYKPTDMNKHSNRPMADLYLETKNRVDRLRALGYNVTEMWGCDWRKILCNDHAVAEKVKSFKIKTPLSPRDALVGGRTNALWLLEDAIPGKTVIRYYDFKVKLKSFYKDLLMFWLNNDQ